MCSRLAPRHRDCVRHKHTAPSRWLRQRRCEVASLSCDSNHFWVSRLTWTCLRPALTVARGSACFVHRYYVEHEEAAGVLQWLKPGERLGQCVPIGIHKPARKRTAAAEHLAVPTPRAKARLGALTPQTVHSGDDGDASRAPSRLASSPAQGKLSTRGSGSVLAGLLAASTCSPRVSNSSAVHRCNCAFWRRLTGAPLKPCPND